jgi:hypothetical protein
MNICDVLIPIGLGALREFLDDLQKRLSGGKCLLVAENVLAAGNILSFAAAMTC